MFLYIVSALNLTKSGQWNCNSNNYDRCWTNSGAEFGLEFEGNGFEIYGDLYDLYTYFDVYLDGVNVSRVNEKVDSHKIFSNLHLFTYDNFGFGHHFLTINGSSTFVITRIVTKKLDILPIEPVTPVPTPVPCLTNYFLKVNCTTFIDHYDIDDGGIMNIKNGGIFISHVQFINCSSLNRGGAIFLYNTVTPYPCRVFCTKFDGCKANGGGAICIIQN